MSDELITIIDKPVKMDINIDEPFKMDLDIGTTTVVKETIVMANDHAKLENLDYANSGHTGFASLEDLRGVSSNVSELNTEVDNVKNQMPTRTSDLVNDGENGTGEYTEKTYVDNLADELETYTQSVEAKVQTLQETKLDRDGGTITGDLAIQGNLTVNGEVVTEKQKTLEVEDNIVYTNANKVELRALLSGLAIYKDGTNLYGILYDPATDSVKLGIGYRDDNGVFHFNANDGSPVAVREDSSKLIDKHIMIWDSATNKLVDSGKTTEDFVDLVSEQTIGGLKKFAEEIQADKGVYSSGDIVVNDSVLKTIDTNKDLVTEYSADEIVTESGTGENAQTYNRTLPLKSGTLATLDDIPSQSIPLLVGTTDKPINLATDLEFGKYYILSGELYRRNGFTYTLTENVLCITMAKNTQIGLATFFNYALNASPQLHTNNTQVGFWLVDYSTNHAGDISYENRGRTSVKFNNTNYLDEELKIYAPLTSGNAGQIQQSNGANKAPTWIDMPEQNIPLLVGTTDSPIDVKTLEFNKYYLLQGVLGFYDDTGAITDLVTINGIAFTFVESVNTTTGGLWLYNHTAGVTSDTSGTFVANINYSKSSGKKAGAKNYTLCGAVNGSTFPTTSGIYVPTTAGENGQILQSTGGTPKWVDLPSDSVVVEVTSLSSILTEDEYNSLEASDVTYIKYTYAEGHSYLYRKVQTANNNISFTFFDPQAYVYIGKEIYLTISKSTRKIFEYDVNLLRLPATRDMNQAKINDLVSYQSGGFKLLAPTDIATKQQTYYLTELPSTTGTPYAEHDQVVINNQDVYALETVDSTLTWVKKYSMITPDGGTFTGDVNIQGNLSVSGTTTTKDTETLKVKDNIIVTNSDKASLLDLSGFAINKNESSTYGIMYDPVSDSVKLGLGTIDTDGKFSFNSGEGAPVAIRADSELFINDRLVKWDSNKNQFVDCGKDMSDNATASTIATRTLDGALKSTPITDIDIENQSDDTVATKKDLSNKVDKVEGKQLSTNDFTDDYKTKIDNSIKKNMLDIYVGTADACSDTDSNFGQCVNIYNTDGSFYTTRKFLFNKDDFTQEGTDDNKKYSLSSTVARKTDLANYVPKQTADDGVVKAYTINGSKSDDVCTVSMTGAPSAIARYGPEGQLVSNAEPTADNYLCNKTYTDGIAGPHKVQLAKNTSWTTSSYSLSSGNVPNSWGYPRYLCMCGKASNSSNTEQEIRMYPLNVMPEVFNQFVFDCRDAWAAYNNVSLARSVSSSTSVYNLQFTLRSQSGWTANTLSVYLIW